MIEDFKPSKVAPERGSPQWAIDRLEGLSARIFDWVSRRLERERWYATWSILLPLLAIYVYWVQRTLVLDLIGQDTYLVYFLRLFFIGSFTVFIASVIDLSQERNPDWDLAGPTIAAFAAKAFLYRRATGPNQVLVEVAFFIATGILLFLVSKYSKRRTLSPLVGGFLILLFGFWIFVDRFPFLFSPQYLLMPLVVFWSEWTNVNASIPIYSVRRLLHLISPINVISGFPIRHLDFRCSPDRRRGIRVQAVFDFGVATLCALIYYQLKTRFFMPVIGLKGAVKLPAIGLLYYILQFLKSYWFFRILTGIGRWIGLDLKDSFNYPFFATSPMERWRRWSIPYHFWLRDFVFFPIMARTRLLFWSVAVTFAVSLFLHSFINFAFWWDAPEGLAQGDNLARSKAVYYALQMRSVYASLKVPSIWPSGERRSGWYGVAVTLGLMVLIHAAVWSAL